MAYNPKSLENLTPYPKGVSGNPSGPPKGYKKLSCLLDKILEQKVEIEGANVTRAEQIILTLCINAQKGDNQAIKEIFDRIEGKAVSTNIIDATVNNGFESLTDAEKKEKLGNLLGKLNRE